MKKIKSANFFWLLPLCYLLVIPSACLQKEEGCRDVAATNFAADAEVDCVDCCSYPNITFEIEHAAGDTSLRYGDTIAFDNKVVNFLEVGFYINGISLSGAGQTITINDEITLTDRAGEENLTTNDVKLISRNISSFSYQIGTFTGQGSYDTLGFQVGLTDIQAATDPESVPAAHPLASDNGRFELPDSAYIFTLIRLVNVENNDTLQYNIKTAVNITLPYSVTINRGFDLDIPIKVDYLQWIEGIDFVDNPEMIKQIIVGNLSKAFSIRE